MEEVTTPTTNPVEEPQEEIVTPEETVPVETTPPAESSPPVAEEPTPEPVVAPAPQDIPDNPNDGDNKWKRNLVIIAIVAGLAVAALSFFT